MKKKEFFLIASLIILFCTNCICRENNFSVQQLVVDKALGIPSVIIDSTKNEYSAYIKILDDLNNSNFESAKNRLNAISKVEKSTFDGISYYVIEDRVDSLEFLREYCLYRINEYLNDVPVNILIRQLFGISLNEGSNWFKDVLEIEQLYLSIIKAEKLDSISVRTQRFMTYLDKYSQSGRVVFLANQLFLKQNNKNKTKETFADLYERNYYKVPIARTLSENYWKDRKADELSLLFEKSKKNMSSEYVAMALYNWDLNKNYDSIVGFIRQRPQFFTSKDSVVATYFMMNSLLQLNEFKELETLLQSYKDYVYTIGNPVSLWFRGEYHNITMVSFFKKKQFSQLKKYFFNSIDVDVRFNNITEEAFYEYVKQLYIDDVGSEVNFRDFYNANFALLQQ